MIEEFSLKEEIIDYKNNAYESIYELQELFKESIDYFQGPWNENQINKFNEIMKTFPILKKQIDDLIESIE